MTKTLILGLGNEIIADDAIGILAARELQSKIASDSITVIESSIAGIALMEIMMDYDKCILIDAIATGKHNPGIVIQMKPEELGSVVAPSAHYAGIPEVIALAKQMEIEFPDEIVIFAMEVLDPLTIGGEMTQPVKDALPVLIEQVQNQLKLWGLMPK